ncbi:hypothetical protein B0H16DRAFT_1737006 [Mycena metata]|uniref:Uncharacterized protein n=1 Tax=Mycena metata TaxID=1033252 RepID=A0AAD7HM51_9AGAR|nr:hypothetical protein B0H16DRAFT_1737006 [Mycena metata]
MENGWTRLTSRAVADIGPIPDGNSSIIYSIEVGNNGEHRTFCSWLSQANHIFTQLLSSKDALDLKFPFIDFDMEIWGSSWDDTIYAYLGEFHERKGISKGLHIPFALEPYGELGGNDSSIREENTTSSDELVVNFALTCDDLEVFTPSWIWNILICFQIGLIVSLAIFSFVDYLHMCM